MEKSWEDLGWQNLQGWQALISTHHVLHPDLNVSSLPQEVCSAHHKATPTVGPVGEAMKPPRRSIIRHMGHIWAIYGHRIVSVPS
jgi:hypothetical protein